MPQQQSDLALRVAIEDFQSREILLLQSGDFRAWLNLLTEDVRYWMPVVSVVENREDAVAGDGELGWWDDDKPTLAKKIERLYNPMAVDENPHARTRYYVQNLRITPQEGGTTVRVESNVIAYRTRKEKQEHVLYGGREDVLKLVDGEWKLGWRKVTLDRSVPYPTTIFM